MEPLILRAYKLKEADLFKKEGQTYKVITIDKTGIYYTQLS